MSNAFTLCAFADEINPDFAEQIRVMAACGIPQFELRSAWGVNVLDLTPAQRTEIKSRIADAGMSVLAIGSPVGKVKITESWEGGHEERFKIAVDAAQYFGAPFIRLFSYYEADAQRAEVIRRFRAKVDYVRNLPVTLVHENEAKIYGEKGDACLDLMQAIASPKLRMAFDFANFVQAGEKPLEQWPKLRDFSVHIHVKDAILGSGKVVPAGEGDGHIAEILKDAAARGYKGALSLEPHLASHGQFSGFSGEKLFTVAADALKNLLRKNDLPFAKFGRG